MMRRKIDYFNAILDYFNIFGLDYFNTIIDYIK